MTLPSDDTHIQNALAYSRRATCPRLSVGAVIVVAGQQVAQGWNGSRRGKPSCLEIGCDLQELHGRRSCQRAIHAEANAIFHAAREGIRTLGATCYVTHAPCARCADVLYQSGIARVVYAELYGPPTGVDSLAAAGVEVVRWNP